MDNGSADLILALRVRTSLVTYDKRVDGDHTSDACIARDITVKNYGKRRSSFQTCVLKVSKAACDLHH